MKVLLLVILPFLFPATLSQYNFQNKMSGDPYSHQTIPGKMECEFYDKGGESVAYHDVDSINNGSGKLNPANGTYLNEFRMHEGVDISYTKPKAIDDNPFGKLTPAMDQLYVGWTQTGEWINYTVTVKENGTYKAALMYTANGDGEIAFDFDKKPVATALKIPSTHNDTDSVAWRQWHHWNKIDSLTAIRMDKGTHVLTLHITGNGNMNFDYFEFTKE